VFLFRDVFILYFKKMGAEGKHLSFLVRDSGGSSFRLIAFNAKDDWFLVENDRRADFAVRLEENEWRGVRSVEGRVLGVFSSAPLED
jgi:hypothetical protein